MTKNTIALIIFCCVLIGSCTYKTFKPGPSPYDKDSLLDSARNEAAFVYYKNDPSIIYSGTNGPHGAFKLKFNKMAYAALTDNDKLPVGGVFPNGSFIVKEVAGNGVIAFMYKRNGTWLWGEFKADGSTIFDVSKDPDGTCINCHSQSGQRDLVVSFNFY